MKLFGCQQIAAILMVLVATCCVSCNRPASTTTPAGAKNAKPGPEKSLTEIMDVFRRLMEDTPIGFVKSGPTGRTAMTGANKVSYELVRPATDGEPYKAVVTVDSKSHYSILRTPDGSRDDKRDEADKDDQSADILDDTNPDAVAFDAEKSTKTADDARNPKSTTRPGEAQVALKKDGEVRKYELVYESGRWRLVTKLDEQTEKATENAFNNALKIQI